MPEPLDLKTAISRQWTTPCRPTVLATNTSSLPVTETRPELAARPGRRVHFFNPAPVQTLVEMVGTVVTEQDVLDDLKALAVRLDKDPVIFGDQAGFIANTLLFGYLNHAVSFFEGRYASARTSTPRCGSAAVTRWAPWPCST